MAVDEEGLRGVVNCRRWEERVGALDSGSVDNSQAMWCASRIRTGSGGIVEGRPELVRIRALGAQN